MTHRLVRLLAGVLLFAAAHDAAAQDAAGASDRFEVYNRWIYGWNVSLTGGALGGVMPSMTLALPAGVRGTLHRAVQNLREPVYAVSALATADTAAAWNAAARFAINTTAGRLGTEDAAAAMGYPPRTADLGIELCRAGVLSDAAFIELPLIGPYTTRDAAARLVTNVALYAVIGSYFYPYYAVDLLDRYDMAASAAPPRVEPPRVEPADPYAAQRDAYLARRAEDCRARLASAVR